MRAGVGQTDRAHSGELNRSFLFVGGRKDGPLSALIRWMMPRCQIDANQGKRTRDGGREGSGGGMGGGAGGEGPTHK